MASHKYPTWIVVIILALAAAPFALAADRPLEFHVTYDARVTDKPFTGRVYVLLSPRALEQPPAGLNWFRPEPLFAADVKGWKPGEPVTLGARSLATVPLDKLERGAYTVTALMDFDRGDISFAAAAGNGYSKPTRLELNPAAGGPVKLTIDQVVPARTFRETDKVKLVDIESKLLSKFEGRPVRMKAGVVLPKSFAAESRKKYPVIFEIPGFSGDHRAAFFASLGNRTEVAGTEMLYVVLDPSCRNGHHVFADSANNGPRGQALVEELIPHIEKEFRGLGVPGGRFLTGHSSGGWSSLWLQVTYPDFFGGTWSTAPDPVDFRAFQLVDIYKSGANLFVDGQGKPIPIARRGGKPVLFTKPFSDMETVMGHGGQLGSFEAVFSERGPDGSPRQLWNRDTGAIDPAVAASWKKYDIRLILEQNWKALGPRLAGKIRVHMGLEDTFYLDGATVLLKESLAKLGGDAVVEVYPGKDHSTVMDGALRERIKREMAEQARKATAGKEP